MQFYDRNLGRSAVLNRPLGHDDGRIPTSHPLVIPMSLPANASCPCQSGKTYETCCGPFDAGSAWPATAEALMRARYCAYVVHKIDYIERTDHPSRKGGFDRKAAEQWSTLSEWMGLDIIAKEKGGEADSDGVVEFRARFRIRGQEAQHHERSTFAKAEGRWYYVDGDRPAQKPFVHDKPAVNRNDPCPCGSGKKFKKCCGK